MKKKFEPIGVFEEKPEAEQYKKDYENQGVPAKVERNSEGSWVLYAQVRKKLRDVV